MRYFSIYRSDLARADSIFHFIILLDRLLERISRGSRRPDAIVCGNDETAKMFIRTLQSIGKRAPEDLAIVGFDDLPLARTTDPPLTTVTQPVKKIAAAAFKTLMARIRYPNNDPREIYLVAPLVARQSA